MAAPQDECAHLPLLDVAYELRANKSTYWRQSTIARAQAAVNVLSEESLLRIDLRPRLAESPETFSIKIGDLTPEGFEFSRTGYQRWLANQDRWKEPRTVEKLEDSLRKYVKKFRAASA